VLSIAALFLALSGIDWHALGMLLRQVHLGWLLMAVAVQMLTIGVNAVRWRWLFWPHYSPRVAWLFGILNAAQLANAVLPGRLGLLVRVLLVGERGQISRATALTTLAVEKVLEGVTLLFVGIPLFLTLELPQWLRLATILSSVALMSFLVIMGISLRWRESLLTWMSTWTAGWLSGGTRALLDGLDSLRSHHVAWRLLGWSAVYWALVAVVTALVMRAVGLQVATVAILLLLFVLQLGVRLPSSPGNVGVFEFLGVLSLSIFGVDKTSALGAMLVLHLVFYLPASLVGVGYLLWTSTGLGQLRRAAMMLQEN
jgi:uncharacterized membrane protein YbhN (UPF0104 family)